MADADWPAPTRRSKQTSPIETAARYSPGTPNLIGGIREESQLNRDWCVTRRVVSKLADLTSATRSRARKSENHITLIELCHLVVLFYILLDFSWILFTPLELTLCLVRLQIYKFLYGLNIQEVNTRVWRRTKQSIWKVMGTILRWKLYRRKTVFFSKDHYVAIKDTLATFCLEGHCDTEDCAMLDISGNKQPQGTLFF